MRGHDDLTAVAAVLCMVNSRFWTVVQVTLRQMPPTIRTDDPRIAFKFGGEAKPLTRFSEHPSANGVSAEDIECPLDHRKSDVPGTGAF